MIGYHIWLERRWYFLVAFAMAMVFGAMNRARSMDFETAVASLAQFLPLVLTSAALPSTKPGQPSAPYFKFSLPVPRMTWITAEFVTTCAAGAAAFGILILMNLGVVPLDRQFLMVAVCWVISLPAMALIWMLGQFLNWVAAALISFFLSLLWLVRLFHWVRQPDGPPWELITIMTLVAGAAFGMALAAAYEKEY